MPIERTTQKGKPCYRWGSSGKCYPYTPGNKKSRERAKQKAKKQGRAVASSKKKRKKKKRS